MSEEESTKPAFESMAPADPPLPYKTWRGTIIIASAVVVFLAVLAFLLYRWADLQTFSPELRFEGYHRFAGDLLKPDKLFASKLIKVRIRTYDGKVLVLPPVPDVKGEKPIASYEAGVCVEGYVNTHKGFVEQLMLKIQNTTYLLSMDEEWIVTQAEPPQQ